MADYKKEGESSLAGVRQKIAEKLKNDDNRVMIGYEGQKIDRQDGDVWEDNGKTWTVKNGIKQTVSKLQTARMPLWCPKCNKTMPTRIDTKMFNIHGMCFGCVLTMEQKLRDEGKFEEYENKKLRENEISYLKDTIDRLNQAYDDVKNPSFILQDGRIESWSSNIEAIKQDILNDIESFKNRLNILEPGMENVDTN